MDTKHPGIFIPLLNSAGHINITKGEECIPYGSTQLFNAMQKNGIKGDFHTAVRFCARKNKPVEYGLILHLEDPQQSEYEKALQTINQTFGLELDELTIPYENVIIPKLGVKTSSVFAEKRCGARNIFEFNEQGFMVINFLHLAQLEDCKLILSPILKGFAIHATSPLNMESTLWKELIGTVLHNAGYTSTFSQTWSTNKKLQNS